MIHIRRNVVQFFHLHGLTQSKVCEELCFQVIKKPALHFSTSGVKSAFKLDKSRWVAPYLMALKRQSDELKRRGVVPEDRRSTYIEW
ncbi:hypothetical protein FHG87_019080 [Trinorchestia longiramus]|nr:hypothetical protein FHG87_019080 [Trinorchestia longiramus]